MADASLDDFFAKKDKTKRKSKAKNQTSGEGEESGKTGKKEKKKRERDGSSIGTTNVSVLKQEDEEWKDFEEEKEADYTGLRIQNLQIAREEQDREIADGADEDGSDEIGENEKRDGLSGPWNKSSSTAAAVTPTDDWMESSYELSDDTQSAQSHPEPVKEETPAKTPGKYVPPAQRYGSAQSTPSFPTSRRKKEAPNVHSEEDFPTLGGGPTPARWGGDSYSTSSSSDLIENPGHRKGANLTLENKFAALQD